MKKALLVFAALMTVATMTGCNSSTPAKASAPVVKKATARVQVGVDGTTIEQKNVKKRLEEDSKVGAIKHLYVISAYSGQTIIHSVVKGKVTSSGKRLTTPVKFSRGDRGSAYGDFITPRMGDDGTYGSSVPYLYWWDTAGKYHQHFVSGGQIIHVSDQPFKAKAVIMNVEVSSVTQ